MSRKKAKSERRRNWEQGRGKSAIHLAPISSYSWPILPWVGAFFALMATIFAVAALVEG